MFFNRPYTISNIRNNTVGVHTRVPVINGKMVNYINLDNAASTPPLIPVLKKVNSFLENYSNIHRGAGYKSRVSTEMFEQARENVSAFVNSDTSKNIVIFVKNTTEAINKLSYRINLSKGDIIITSLMEHHSNDLPWRNKAKVIHTNVLNNGRLDINDLESKLQLYKGKVKLVALTGASNVTGYINDINKIASLVHRYDAKILIDGAQLVPHRKINMKGYRDDDSIDFLAFSAHKMYAPFGVGVLIGPKTTFSQGSPEYVGGGTIKSVSKYNIYWGDTPDKEEAGTPCIIGAIALSESINILKQIGMNNIKEHENKLLMYLHNELSTLPDVKLFSLPKKKSFDDMVGVTTFDVKGIPHNLLASALSYEGGIGVRSGCFCAHPYIHKLLNLSLRDISSLQKDLILGNNINTPGLVRISFGLYNTKKEIDLFINVLKSIIKRKEKLYVEYKYNKITREYMYTNTSKDYCNSS